MNRTLYIYSECKKKKEREKGNEEKHPQKIYIIYIVRQWKKNS